jgi:hypothetical protein
MMPAMELSQIEFAEPSSKARARARPGGKGGLGVADRAN